MKRLTLIVAAFVLLAAGSAAHANWFGLRTGYPLGLTLHYGIDDALDNGFDLRVNGRIFARGGSISVGLGVDALGAVLVEPPFTVYIGGGPAIEFGGDIILDLHALVGAEFRFSDLGLDPLGIFVEGTLGAEIGLSTGRATIPAGGAALGFNWHF